MFSVVNFLFIEIKGFCCIGRAILIIQNKLARNLYQVSQAVLPAFT